MVDLEVLSSHAQGDMNKLFGQFASLLIVVSILLAWLALASGTMGPDFSWPMEFLLITTTMLVVGLFGVLSWDSTFPNRRDVLVLGPLPVRGRTLFLAKIAAVGSALGLTVVTLHCLSGLAWPLALNRTAPARTIPDLRYDAALRPVNAANLQAVLDRDLAQALQSGLLAPGSGAGVSIGVSEHGVRRVFSYGAARPDSLFEIGSITKTFTGLILAQMIAQGKARLDEPVRELLPTGLVSKPAGREMTLLDLATHHSGLPRMPSNFHPADRTRPFADYHAEQLYEFLRIYPWGMSNPTPTRFLYSNLGFGLLGQALALRAGTEYPALLQQQVIGPLGLHDTVVTLSAEQHGRFIQGHDADLHPVPAWDLDGLAGAGAIRSTAGDILTYLEAQLHPERWRGAGTLGEALAFSHVLRADAGNGARIALAWMYNTADENYEHGGATGGFSSHAFFDPKRDYAAIVLLNTAANNGFADVLGIHIRQRLAGQPAQSLTYVTIPPGGGVVNFVRVFAAYWVVMLAAGAFIFCCVLGLQGLTAQLLPRQLFLRLSPFLQMGALCLFVCVYILQLMAAGSNELLAAMSGGALAWSPGFWFLGLFQQLSGSPAMPVLARRAWIGLAAAVSVTAVAYLLSYLRTLRQIVEEPDILRSRRAGWWPVFGDSLSRAVMQFSARTLLRSRQHRMILTFYLGIGFGATIFFLKVQQEAGEGAFNDPVNVRLLAASIMMLGCLAAGTRVVFALPLELAANWVFRAAPIQGGLRLLAARRRAFLLLAVAPVTLFAGALFPSIWPWRQALGHIAVLALLGLLFGEICLMGFQKIPFACSYLPGKSNFHLTFWLCVGLITKLVDTGAGAERQALDHPLECAALLAGLGIVTGYVRRRNTQRVESDTEILFEDEPVPAVQVLGLPRDGGLVAGDLAGVRG